MDSQKSYYHRGGDVPLLGATIPEHLAEITERFPEHEAIVSVHQQRRLTYRELDSAVIELACGLLALGYQRGDRIGIWSTNNIEWLLLQLATARIGVILVNINPAYQAKELEYSIQRSELQGIFIIPAFKSSHYVEMLQELIPELEQRTPLASKAFPLLRHVVLYEPEHPEKSQRPAPGFTLWQEVLNAASEVTEEVLSACTVMLDRDDVINIQYTSGTTGFPKAVMLTHHNILNNAWFSAQAMHFHDNDRLAVSVPFYHCFGIVLSNLLCLSVGACLVLPAENFDALAVLKAVERERCTAIHGVPTMFIAALEHEQFNEFDLSSLRTGIMAGAPCPPALMKRVIELMHCKEILIGYGQTEASPLTHLTTRDDSFERRINSVGHNLPHQEVKVVDTESGQTLPVGSVGEVCFRGYHIMRGYYGQPDKTAETVNASGWLFSGDLGAIDCDGYLKITGRLKEMIIRGGESIYPREIEDYLFTHPRVAEVAVFGLPDEFYGEEVVAWIQLHAGESCSEDDIRDFCKGNIAHFKIPKYIRFVDTFPMTVTGKLQKFKMCEQMQQEMGE